MNITDDGGIVWPRTKSIVNLNGRTSFADFEEWSSHSFQGYYPIVFETGREAIRAVGQVLHSRGMHSISVPPYTTQCVVQALTSANLIPNTPTGSEVVLDFIYHQYGHFFKQEKDSIIEDSVDTIFKIGRSPFRTNSEFAVWSFRKSFGLELGGLAWCRDRSTALELTKHSRALMRKESGLEICLTYVQNSWQYVYECNQKRILSSFSLLENFDNKKSMNRYKNMLREGILPAAIEVEESGIPRLVKSLSGNIKILRRHFIHNPSSRNEESFFLPIWQVPESVSIG